MVAALGCALLLAAFTDIRGRIVENWLNAGIALAAPLYWWASGYQLWPDMAIQIAVAALVFAIFAGVFAIGAMGGGDVKLIGALALWLPFQQLIFMLLVMSIAGGVLTAAMAVVHKIRKSKDNLEIPYAVAIAAGGLWVLGASNFNHFA
ncbi:A24 family peptidase [Sphingobium boeckii]|uniref:Prepilin peptidase CpaA n=1 Tax=Sphingobium boeckii TaxID=1082345 RepID=A0A7W9EGF2_9SPHN|nr:prepilin peptidase [Sphingobium boeckii]MBB5687065.1 prepilin peptidase CpaA [Sphingobium boeckii]